MEQCAGRNDRNSRTERRGGRTVRIAERRKRGGSGENRQTARRRGGKERCGERLFKRRRQEESYDQQSLHGLPPGEPVRPGKRETDFCRIRPAVCSIEEGAYREPSGDDNRKYAGNREYAVGETIGYADPCSGRMTEESLRQFERHLRQEGKKASTVEKYLRDVKAFWFWLQETEKESKESAEEECGGGEERLRKELDFGVVEGGSETGVVSGAGGRDERTVHEADETDNVSEIGEKSADRRIDLAGENEGRKHGGRDFSGGENSAVEENTDSLFASAAVTKARAWRWRDFLCEKGYAPVTVNAMLAALNLFLRFLGRDY